MNTKTNIEQQVMGSVAAVYVARRFFNPLAIKIYALALSAVGIVAFVSLSHVGANFLAAEHSGFSAMGAFSLSAVTKTTLLVQLALAIGVLALFSLLSDAFKSLRSSSFPRQGRAA
ncbi:MAG: hypothetical protein WCI89_00205 [bacterium]